MRAMDPVRLFSDTFGVDYSAAAYLVGALSSIPFAYLHRFIGPPALRHVYAAVSGVLLSLISFTPDVLLHFILAAAFTLVVMRTQRRICGLVTFIGTFAHLIACHVIFMSDDARRTGRVDFTGTLTIVAIKLTSLAMDYQDGLKALKDDAKRAKDGEKPESEQPSGDDRRKAEKRARVIKEMPSLVEFLGYLFCCGQHLLGPWFDYQSYDDWTHRRGVWSPAVRSPSPIPPFLRVLMQSALAAAVFLLIFPHLDLSLATDPARFFALPFLRRLLLVFHATLVTRWRCYIGGSTAAVKGSAVSGEKKRAHAATAAAPAPAPAAAPATGAATGAATRTDADDAPACSRAGRQVAASGAERQVASWDRARNVNILGMELASTGADVAKNWNISFSTWLRIYVYERLEAMPRKSALFNLLFTFFISAISHGLNPGDLIGFAHWALMIAGSRVIYRWTRPLPQGSLRRRVASFLHFLYVLLCINYAGFGFSVMTLQHTVQAYRGLYYYGTIVPVVLILAGNFIRTARAKGGKKSLKTE
ncbi:unnamed protein product [Closterium sp. Yama58-4]|nr:unnamed protein product [Closterium sp. Yama58-4]